MAMWLSGNGLNSKKVGIPKRLLHTICAFANDINNWVWLYCNRYCGKRWDTGFAAKRTSRSELAKNQKELLNLCHKITPAYFPVAEVASEAGKNILILWVPGGQHRPYKAAVSLAKKSEYAYYIRRFSSTKKANHEEELVTNGLGQ